MKINRLASGHNMLTRLELGKRRNTLCHIVMSAEVQVAGFI